MELVLEIQDQDGWAAVLISGDNKKEISGGSKETTNNIMELTAILEALKALKKECEVDLYSDSAYCVNAFNQDWIYGWIKKNELARGEIDKL